MSRRSIPGLLLAIATGVLGMLLLLELLLRALPVSGSTRLGYHFDADLLTYPAGWSWTTSTGWDLRNVQHLKANNWGFVADHDFQRDDNAVALVGDSYVEGSMLDAPQRGGAQLEALLGGTRPVYAMGSPGTALLDHAQRIRVAAQQFGVRDFVLLLEAGDARQSLCGSANVHSRCLDPVSFAPRIERLPPPSAFKRVARESALAGYLMGQLKLGPQRLRLLLRAAAPPSAHAAPATATPAAVAPLSPRSRQVVDAVVDRFFIEARPFLRGRTVFLVDGSRDGRPDPGELGAERRYLIERLSAAGGEVVDLTPVYAAHAARSPLALRVGPYDGHLNGLGLTLAMAQAARLLQSPR